MKIFGITASVAIAAAACTVESADVASDSDDVTSSACKARLHWLQKDAYKSSAGRTSDLWPPHTTTELEIVCQSHGVDKLVTRVEMDNHGTKVGAVDASGKVILVETKLTEIAGSKSKLLALAKAYGACECDSVTDFLSLDNLDQGLEKDLIGKVAAYLQANLVCPNGTDGILAALQGGRIDEVLGTLPSCTWKSGKSLAGGLDEAMGALAAETQGELGNYHVCNNDAELQAQLVADFAATGKVRACDAQSPVCHSPSWFYNPNKSSTAGH